MLINLRNALMGGKRLPYDAELEYLEFTGTQRLLTDITPNVYGRNLKTSISYQLTSTASRQLSGSASSYFEFCSNGALVQSDASYPADLNRHTLDFIGWNTSNSPRVLYDGQNIAQGGFIRSTNTSNHFTFGSLNANSQSNPLKAKVYSLSMGYQDGTKLLDWVPVRVGTTGYMYDRVSKRLFGNAGTGDFVVGQDVVPVAYIESHGTEWIDTGYIPNQQTRWELDYQFTSIGLGLNGMFQDYPTIRFNLGQEANGFFNISYGANNTLSITADTLRHFFVMDIPNLQWRLDSSSGAFPGAVTNTLQNSLRIFCRNSTGGRAYNLHSGRCFASRMYQSDALSQRLLPVRVGTEGAMMDVLTRRIYRNAGTGAFSYGNDLKYPIPAA